MSELVGLLVKQLGIQDAQAQGGAGLLFKALKDRLAAGDFATLSKSLGGLDTLIAAAPKPPGAAGLLGGLASAIGGKAGDLGALASLAAGFKGLGLDVETAKRFVPIILGFVQSKGGEPARAIVAKVTSEIAAKLG